MQANLVLERLRQTKLQLENNINANTNRRTAAFAHASDLAAQILKDSLELEQTQEAITFLEDNA